MRPTGTSRLLQADLRQRCEVRDEANQLEITFQRMITGNLIEIGLEEGQSFHRIAGRRRTVCEGIKIEGIRARKPLQHASVDSQAIEFCLVVEYLPGNGPRPFQPVGNGPDKIAVLDLQRCLSCLDGDQTILGKSLFELQLPESLGPDGFTVRKDEAV